MYIHKTKGISLKHASTGLDLLVLDVKYHYYRCPQCRCIVREEIPYRCDKARHSTYFKSQTLALLSFYGYTMKRTAQIMHCLPALVKEFKKEYLNHLAGDLKPRHFSRYIAIDEFLLEHPHRYCTIVIDAITGELLYLEKGKSKAQVEGFMRFVGRIPGIM